MKPTIEKVKNMRGRVTGYRAKLGEVVAEGKTAAEAFEACEKKVLLALERLDRGAIVRTWRGHSYTVAPTIVGWEYMLDTFTGYYGVNVNGSREDAEDAALHHLAQQLWTTEDDDETFVRILPSKVAREILRWCAWQRRFATLKAEGKTDNEAHQLASAS
jgi:hypothetical protein